MLINRKIREKILEGTNSNGLAGSQVGNIQSLLEQNKYNPERCIKIIEDYFKHALETEERKNKLKEKKSVNNFGKHIQNILEMPLNNILGIESISEIMGISTDKLLDEKDEKILKINYLLDLIKYEKKGKEE